MSLSLQQFLLFLSVTIFPNYLLKYIIKMTILTSFTNYFVNDFFCVIKPSIERFADILEFQILLLLLSLKMRYTYAKEIYKERWNWSTNERCVYKTIYL